jgi:hypothetical protein
MFIIASIPVSQIVDNPSRRQTIGIDMYRLWNQTYSVNSLPVADE